MAERSWWRPDAAHWQRTGVIVAIIAVILTLLGGALGLVTGSDDSAGSGAFDSTSPSDGGSGSSSETKRRSEQLDVEHPAARECDGFSSTVGTSKIGHDTFDFSAICEMYDYPGQDSSIEFEIPDGTKLFRVRLGIGNTTQRASAQLTYVITDGVTNAVLAKRVAHYGKVIDYRLRNPNVLRLAIKATVTNEAPVDNGNSVYAIVTTPYVYF